MTDHTPSTPAALTVDEARALKRDDPRTRLIDVRTPGEFASLHIPGSSNVPLDLLRERRADLAADHSDPVVLVCRSGMRAEEARKLIDAAGLTGVGVLQGGITAWQAAGAPVEKGRGTWAMERQVRFTAGSIVLVSVLAGLAYPPLTWVAAFIGAGLVFAAVSDTCAMARVLGLLPWNRAASGDSGATLSALTGPAASGSAEATGEGR
ncbi:rhodanese-like domain-containing protein [Nocardiopsis sp. RSe5-2]|uniref:Rhodanese-like domain-containing protein n=1 Tax=Nocardiopsis endophytica TaxID=3018445 RepID=A0ABT4TZM9_9ACTN|nr:rhodanese-like domain-containing protein [Nocardiopsis endophytica]MDA2810145.1 rhodanese-like domain-containing protein [Nocardiopsis endophytica]